MLPATQERFKEIFFTVFEKVMTVITSKTTWAVILLVNSYLTKKIDTTTFLTSLSTAVIAFRTIDISKTIDTKLNG